MADKVYLQYVQEKGYPPKQINHLIAFAKQKGIKVSYKDIKIVIQQQPSSLDDIKVQHKTTKPNAGNNQQCKPVTVSKQKDQKNNVPTNDADIWQAYVKRMGNPPTNSFQLMMFCRKHDDVKNISNQKAKEIFDAVNKQQQPSTRQQRSISVSKQNYSYQISVKYEGKVYLISLHKSVDKYTVADLRKEVLQKYINEPATSLIFKLDSAIVHRYEMDIIAYFKQYHKREILFEIEYMDRNRAVSKAPKTALQQEIESHGTNVQKLIDSLKQKFETAYFTENTVEKKEDIKSLGDWDQNLNAAVTSVVTGQQTKMFADIVRKFEDKMEKKLQEHDTLSQKIQMNADATTIKQQFNTMMNERRSKIEHKYSKRLQEIEEEHKNTNALWEKAQHDSLIQSNNDPAVKKKIDTERMKRIQYQQRILGSGRSEYLREQQKLNNLHNKQEQQLISTDNIKAWHNKFKAGDVQRERVETLKEMIINKIQTTNAQIQFTKHLHNSPFAKNLKEEAKTLDHEITKIATLAGEPLLIDLVERNVVDEKEDEKEEKYLEFELRFDDDHSNWNELKKLEIRKNLAALMGISAQCLDFVSVREGCIITRFKAKFKAVYDKAKQIGREFIGAVGTGIKYGAEQFKIEMKKLSDQAFVGNQWAKKVDECVPFLEGRLTAIKTNKDAMYLASKCVAVIVSHFTTDKSKSVLDGDFLKDDVDKQAHKIIMDPKWDKEYGPGKTHWEGAIADGIDRGGYPYYCPIGWKRYGIRVDDFDTKYKGWSVCYHGSETYYMGSIMSHGIFGTQDTTQRFFSPSIEFSAYPRYALPKKLKNGKYIQTIFQCRINSDPTIMRKKGSTSGYADGSVIIDPNFDKNTQMTGMEWYLAEPNLDQYVVYGIMVRECDDPTQLPSSHWWGFNLDTLKTYYPNMDR